MNSDGLGHDPVWAGFLPAHQGSVAHFGPNYHHKIGPAQAKNLGPIGPQGQNGTNGYSIN